MDTKFKQKFNIELNHVERIL